ncbi:interleukin-17 receptor D [Antennarius striatus]|uniref:interleukin-17 receptor D n=1 Tax=Antennarius striatus TaxID=241820 RepID=UPI0035B38B96
MAACRCIIVFLSEFLLVFLFGSRCSIFGNKIPNEEQCAAKVQNSSDGRQRLAISLRADNCSLTCPSGKHVIHGVTNVSFNQLACEDQAAVVIHWSASPLGIEHIKGFRLYLEDNNPEGKWCQHLILKDPLQLNFSYRNTKLSGRLFSGLTFDTDYTVRVIPFPTLMNESFFTPSILRTNSCEVLLGPDNLVCKSFWKPKTLNVTQFGSNLHVIFDQAPVSFGFHFYFLYYKQQQDRSFKLQCCKPDVNQARATCILQDLTPGTYTIELRDEWNATRRQIWYHVSHVFSLWAGPIRAMAITVPLVFMSAIATLFTVMCCKNQQENIYNQLGEESSESAIHSASLNTGSPWSRPKVFMCYSNRDCTQHTSVIQSFAYFLQDSCNCEVVLDLWEHLEICREGQMSWLSRQLDEADFIITICSKGLRYYVEKNKCRGKMPICRGGNSSSTSSSLIGGSISDLFIMGVAMIAEKFRLAMQSGRSECEEMSRYITVYFDYSTENDIPITLSLAPRFKMMDQLPQLFSLLHSRESSLADQEFQPLSISRSDYFRSKSGRSLYVSICNMHQHISQNPDWFEKQLDPSSTYFVKHLPPLLAEPISSPTSKPHCPSTSSQPDQSCDSSLVLNEMLVKMSSLQGGKGAPKNNLLHLGPRPSHSPDACPNTGLPHCSLSMLEPILRSTSGISNLLAEEAFSSFSSSVPSMPKAGMYPIPVQAEENCPSHPAGCPRVDSGIYETLDQCLELSSAILDELSHELADYSQAESESSSSGLGENDGFFRSSFDVFSSSV